MLGLRAARAAASMPLKNGASGMTSIGDILVQCTCARRVPAAQIYRRSPIFFTWPGAAALRSPPSFQLPTYAGKHFVHQSLVRLVDEGEFEPAITAQGVQASCELDLRAGGEVIKIVCGAEGEHAR